MQIIAKGKQCIARVKLDSSNTQLLSGLPGFHRWINRDMLFSPTGANINYIAKHWPDAEWNSEAKIFLDDNKPVNLNQLISLIQKSSFIVSNDTGPAHICKHLNKKGLVLFGSHTTARKVSIESENFKSLTVKDLNDLKVEIVLDKVKENLN